MTTFDRILLGFLGLLIGLLLYDMAFKKEKPVPVKEKPVSDAPNRQEFNELDNRLTVLESAQSAMDEVVIEKEPEAPLPESHAIYPIAHIEHLMDQVIHLRRKEIDAEKEMSRLKESLSTHETNKALIIDSCRKLSLENASLQKVEANLRSKLALYEKGLKLDPPKESKPAPMSDEDALKGFELILGQIDDRGVRH